MPNGKTPAGAGLLPDIEKDEAAWYDALAGEVFEDVKKTGYYLRDTVYRDDRDLIQHCITEFWSEAVRQGAGRRMEVLRSRDEARKCFEETLKRLDAERHISMNKGAYSQRQDTYMVKHPRNVVAKALASAVQQKESLQAELESATAALEDALKQREEETLGVLSGKSGRTAGTRMELRIVGMNEAVAEISLHLRDCQNRINSILANAKETMPQFYKALADLAEGYPENPFPMD